MAKKQVKSVPALSAFHAQMIIDAHEIDLEDGEEADLLLAQNPELYEAYRRLIAIARS